MQTQPEYIWLATGEYPLTLSQIRLSLPNTSIPDGECPDEAALVLPTEPPAHDGTVERLVASAVQTDGAWVQQWAVVPLTADEIAQAQQAATVALIAAVQTSAQDRLDAFARTRNYDGILSACTYASSAIPKFALEGQCAVDARDATWAALYALLAEVQGGERPMPTVDEAMQALPALSWPADPS